MTRAGFGEKIFIIFARIYLRYARQIYSKRKILSVSTKALFVVLFLFAANIYSAKAAENSANFLIDPSYDATSRSTSNATNRVTGINAYYYVEDEYWDRLTPGEQDKMLESIYGLSREFDNNIYPKMKNFYGDEWNPGIDSDSRIYILLTDIVKDAGGYFNPNDEYYKNQVKDGRSNEKELIYLNIDYINKPSQKSFLAHEFQHMINWYQKKKISNVDEDVWLNEALSEYSSTLLGYDNPYSESVIGLRLNVFLQHNTDSLTEWQNLNQDYASVNLFMQFLVDHYGKNMIKAIINSKKHGIAAIDESLRRLDYNTSFSEVFSDWEIANYLNDKQIYSERYAYLNPTLVDHKFHIKPTETFVIQDNIPIKTVNYTKDWSARSYEFTSPLAGALQNRALKIIFNADDASANFKIPYIIKNIDGTIAIGRMQLNSLQSGMILFDNFNTKIASVMILPISEKKTDGFTQSEPLVKFSYTVSLSETGSKSLPVISKVSPAGSSLQGGILATIAGENFSADSVVKFGGVSAEIQSADANTIIVKIPPSLQNGSVNVEVINPGSFSTTASQGFTYFSLPENGSLIRADGDYKVYVVNGNYKRWIQSAEIFKFYPHFEWKAVVSVSPQIRDFYQNSYLVRASGDYKVYEVNSDNSKHHLAITAAQFAASGRSWDMVYIINSAEKNFYKTGSTITK